MVSKKEKRHLAYNIILFTLVAFLLSTMLVMFVIGAEFPLTTMISFIQQGRSFDEIQRSFDAIIAGDLIGEASLLFWSFFSSLMFVIMVVVLTCVTVKRYRKSIGGLL